MRGVSQANITSQKLFYHGDQDHCLINDNEMITNVVQCTNHVNYVIIVQFIVQPPRVFKYQYWTHFADHTFYDIKGKKTHMCRS